MPDRSHQPGDRRSGPAGRPPQHFEQPRPVSIPLEKILQNSAQDIDESARKIAEECKDLSNTQMRNFFGPIVRLRSDLAKPSPDRTRHARDLFMHCARVTYMAARDGKARPLERCFTPLVRAAVKNNSVQDDALRAICDFAEALVAYHYRPSK
jgi:CRISPR type III-A-associated protein Csm2